MLPVSCHSLSGLAVCVWVPAGAACSRPCRAWVLAVCVCALLLPLPHVSWLGCMARVFGFGLWCDSAFPGLKSWCGFGRWLFVPPAIPGCGSECSCAHLLAQLVLLVLVRGSCPVCLSLGLGVGVCHHALAVYLRPLFLPGLWWPRALPAFVGFLPPAFLVLSVPVLVWHGGGCSYGVSQRFPALLLWMGLNHSSLRWLVAVRGFLSVPLPFLSRHM